MTGSFTLNLSGSARRSFTRMQRPISVAMLQWLTVGVKKTLRVPEALKSSHEKHGHTQ